MEIINHEYYVSIEVAKLLKEAGFNWDCRGIRVLDSENDPEPVFSTATFKYRGTEVEGYIKLPAPTLDVAQRWLREVKGIEVYAHVFYDFYNMSDGWDVYVYEVNHITKHIEDYITSYDIYHTYEEALEAGIKKALEIILEKGE